MGELDTALRQDVHDRRASTVAAQGVAAHERCLHRRTDGMAPPTPRDTPSRARPRPRRRSDRIGMTPACQPGTLLPVRRLCADGRRAPHWVIRWRPGCASDPPSQSPARPGSSSEPRRRAGTVPAPVIEHRVGHAIPRRTRAGTSQCLVRRERHRDPECQLCHRVMNDWRDLTTMYRRPASGELGVDMLRICAARGCWEKANDRGLLLATPARRGKSVVPE